MWERFQTHLFHVCPNTLLRPHKVKVGHREKALDRDSEPTEHPKTAWAMREYLGTGFYLVKSGGFPSAIIKVNHKSNPEEWLDVGILVLYENRSRKFSYVQTGT